MIKSGFFLFLILSFGAVIFLSGCGKQDSTATGQNNENRRPDFGQPERPSDISGFVKSITGNQVTVIKIDRPNREGDEAGGRTTNNGGADPAVNPRTLFNNGGSSGMAMSGGGGGGGGSRMGMGGAAGAVDSDSRAAMLERLRAMSSGEETITIPVGIQMLKPEAPGSGQRSMIEASLSDITADKMIQVWLDESVPDRKIASFVLITQ